MNSKSSLDSKFAAALEGWMPPARPYLLAVSGGMDSMVLWHFLKSSGFEFLSVCHVNHQLRGDASDLDEAFVRSEAERQGDSFQSVQIDVAARAEQRNQSIELAAREARYGWFAELARSTGYSRVITAHHADDQVETVLINLFRGTGTRGLAGMEAYSRRKVGDTELELYRPMLSISREEIARYAKDSGVPFREDESNADDFALRNRVRNRLIPSINEVFGRDVRGAVSRAAELARLDDELLRELLEQEPFPLSEKLKINALRALSEPHRYKVLFSWLRFLGIPDCGFREVELVNEVVLSTNRPSKANLPGGFHVRRREGTLFVEDGRVFNEPE